MQQPALRRVRQSETPHEDTSRKIAVNCNACGKEYILDPKSLGGRTEARFECRNCGSIFEKSFAQVQNVQGNEEPPVKERKTGNSRLILAPACVLLAAFIAYASYYFVTLIIAPSVMPLAVIQPSIREEPAAAEDRYVFEGTVRNSSGATLRSVDVEVQLFMPDESLISVHKVKLLPQLSNATSSNAALPESALLRVSEQTTIEGGEEIRFSVPVLITGTRRPSSYTIRAFGEAV